MDWYDLFRSRLLHWHWGNHMIAPVPVKEPWRIWVKSGSTCTTLQPNTTKYKTVYIIYGILYIVTTGNISTFHFWNCLEEKNNFNLHFLDLFNFLISMLRLMSLLKEDTNLPVLVLLTYFCGCWWSAYAKIQAIIRHSIDPSFMEYMLIEKVREHSVCVPSQWKRALHCNAISHCLDAYTEWSLEGSTFLCIEAHWYLIWYNWFR